MGPSKESKSKKTNSYKSNSKTKPETSVSSSSIVESPNTLPTGQANTLKAASGSRVGESNPGKKKNNTIDRSSLTPKIIADLGSSPASTGSILPGKKTPKNMANSPLPSPLMSGNVNSKEGNLAVNAPLSSAVITNWKPEVVDIPQYEKNIYSLKSNRDCQSLIKMLSFPGEYYYPVNENVCKMPPLKYIFLYGVAKFDELSNGAKLTLRSYAKTSEPYSRYCNKFKNYSKQVQVLSDEDNYQQCKRYRNIVFETGKSKKNTTSFDKIEEDVEASRNYDVSTSAKSAELNLNSSVKMCPPVVSTLVLAEKWVVDQGKIKPRYIYIEKIGSDAGTSNLTNLSSNYVINIKKSKDSTFVKQTLYLEYCNRLTRPHQNTVQCIGKALNASTVHCFELQINELIYIFTVGSADELERWLSALGKITLLEVSSPVSMGSSISNLAAYAKRYTTSSQSSNREKTSTTTTTVLNSSYSFTSNSSPDNWNSHRIAYLETFSSSNDQSMLKSAENDRINLCKIYENMYSLAVFNYTNSISDCFSLDTSIFNAGLHFNMDVFISNSNTGTLSRNAGKSAPNPNNEYGLSHYQLKMSFFSVNLKHLCFDLKLDINDSGSLLEPFFVHCFLYNFKTDTRVSEIVKLNNTNIKAVNKDIEYNFQQKFCSKVQSPLESFTIVDHVTKKNVEAYTYNNDPFNKLLQKNNDCISTALFSVDAKDCNDVAVVFKIYKLFDGKLQESYDNYVKLGNKHAAKQLLNVETVARESPSCFLTLFGYSFCKLSNVKAGKDEYPLIVYRVSEKYDLQKLLSNNDYYETASLEENEKKDNSKRVLTLPGGKLFSKITKLKQISDLNIITTSLVPRMAKNTANEYYLQATHLYRKANCDYGIPINYFPYHAPTSNCFIQPLALNLSGVKNINAKSLAMNFQLLFAESSDAGLPPTSNKRTAFLPLFYGESGEYGFMSSVSCPVYYKAMNINYNNVEFKFMLPVNLNQELILLVSIFDVNNKIIGKEAKYKRSVCSQIGFSWFKISARSYSAPQEINLPIVANLPLSMEAIDLTNPASYDKLEDVKFIDSGAGKPLIKLRLVPHCDMISLQQDYLELTQLVDLFQPSNTLIDSINISKIIRALKVCHGFTEHDCRNNFYIILEAIMTIFCVCNRDEEKELMMNELLKYSLSLLLHVLEAVANSGEHNNYLYYDGLRYAKCFISTSAGSASGNLHEYFLRAISLTLKTDKSKIDPIYRHFRYIMKILKKSLKNTFAAGHRYAGNRSNSLSKSVLDDLELLYETLLAKIYKGQASTNSNVAANFNLLRENYNNQVIMNDVKCVISLARLSCSLLNLIDRGYCIRLVSLATGTLIKNIRLLPYYFLYMQVLSNHEFWIALNFQIFPNTNLNVVNRFTLSQYASGDSYLTNFYFIGLLMNDLSSFFTLPLIRRQFVMKLLKDSLVKIQQDDRLQADGKNYIMNLYIPFITFVVTNFYTITQVHRQFEETSILQTENKSLRSTAKDAFTNNPTSANKSDLRKNFSLRLKDISSVNKLSLSLGAKESKSITPNTSTANNSNAHSIEQRMSLGEEKMMLLCFLMVLQNLSSNMLSDWWKHLAALTSNDFNRPNLVMKNYALIYGDNCNHRYANMLDFLNLLKYCIALFPLQFRASSNATDAANLLSFDKPDYRRQMSISIEADNSGDGAIISGISSSAVMIGTTGKSCMNNARFYLNKQRTLQKNAENSNNNNNNNSSGSNSNANNLDPITAIEMTNKLDNLMSEEIFILTLEVLEQFQNSQRLLIEAESFNNVLMNGIFDFYDMLLNLDKHSSYTMSLLLARLRLFVQKRQPVIFRGVNNNFCQVLIGSLLDKLPAQIDEICAFLYLLMRCNFFLTKQIYQRTYVNIICAVSSLMNKDGFGRYINYAGQKWLNYVKSDAGVSKNGELFVEISELNRQISTIMRVGKMIGLNSDDPDASMDIFYSLIGAFSETPELLRNWYTRMIRLHVENENFSEAAICYLYSTAVIVQLLKDRKAVSEGVEQFKHITDNSMNFCFSAKDESSVLLTAGDNDMTTVEKGLRKTANLFMKALRYEAVPKLYYVFIRHFEDKKMYRELSNIHQLQSKAYDKMAQVTGSSKKSSRMLGTYYRVIFYGPGFKDLSKKEFIYKEDKFTPLAVIRERLETLYTKKVGNVKINLESNRIKWSSLVSSEGENGKNSNYIQINAVKPAPEYFNIDESMGEYQVHTNLNEFVLETPFTKNGKAHGTIAEQWKRLTILRTFKSFPYMKKRLLISWSEERELTPIEVAMDEMSLQVKQLNALVNLDPPDMKGLQLKLQGSVSVTVNAGPMAYAETFLSEESRRNFNKDHVFRLERIFAQFIDACKAALLLNGELVKEDQLLYHSDLTEKFEAMREKLMALLPGATEC